MTNRLSIIIVAVVAAVIGSAMLTRGKGGEPPAAGTAPRQGDCRYNICLLLDLSDRIAPDKEPLQALRDRKVIAALVDEFGALVKRKLYLNSRDSLRVAVAPQPNDYRQTLLEGGDRLAIDLSSLKVNEKRTRLSELQQLFLAQSDRLYAAAVNNSAFAGSDIWSFFRDNLESYRVTDDGGKPVRNILVVLTDGYIAFDSNAGRPREGGLTSWMEVARLRHAGWEKEFAAGKAGLLPAGKDHGDWEVLVLEAAPRTPKDMPVIRAYWSSWLQGMGISHFRIEPASEQGNLTRETIAGFLLEGRPAKVANGR